MQFWRTEDEEVPQNVEHKCHETCQAIEYHVGNTILNHGVQIFSQNQCIFYGDLH